MKNFTIIVSKKILGISIKHEKKAERQPNEKFKQLGEVRQEDPFQWKVRNNNFDHYNFLATFRNISNFHAFSFRNTRFGCSSVLTNAATLLPDPRCIKISFHFSFMIKTADERIPFKNYIASEKQIFFVSLPLFPSLS
jgi:hypothetical protein